MHKVCVYNGSITDHVRCVTEAALWRNVESVFCRSCTVAAEYKGSFYWFQALACRNTLRVFNVFVVHVNLDFSKLG